MIEREKHRELFMRDPLPRRLGGWAATLRHVSSSARKSVDPKVVYDLNHEARRLIEWTAGETEPEVAAELVRIQILLTVWQKAWETASQNPHERLLLSLQAKEWSDRAVDFSGLL